LLRRQPIFATGGLPIFGAQDQPAEIGGKVPGQPAGLSIAGWAKDTSEGVGEPEG